MNKNYIASMSLVLIFLVGCDTSSNTAAAAPVNFGTASSGSITWKGTGYKHARAMITYQNDTSHTFKLIQIQCVAFNTANAPVSDFLINYGVPLGQQPIQPGATKIKEAVFDNGSQVNSVTCSIERAKI